LPGLKNKSPGPQGPRGFLIYRAEMRI
jgi:hypothetical protein